MQRKQPPLTKLLPNLALNRQLRKPLTRIAVLQFLQWTNSRRNTTSMQTCSNSMWSTRLTKICARLPTSKSNVNSTISRSRPSKWRSRNEKETLPKSNVCSNSISSTPSRSLAILKKKERLRLKRGKKGGKNLKRKKKTLPKTTIPNPKTLRMQTRSNPPHRKRKSLICQSSTPLSTQKP